MSLSSIILDICRIISSLLMFERHPHTKYNRSCSFTIRKMVLDKPCKSVPNLYHQRFIFLKMLQSQLFYFLGYVEYLQVRGSTLVINAKIIESKLIVSFYIFESWPRLHTGEAFTRYFRCPRTLRLQWGQ